jgi:hypothetical protein
LPDRGDDRRFLLGKLQELGAVAHAHFGKPLGGRLQQRLQRVLRDELIGLERQRAVVDLPDPPSRFLD